MRYCDLKPGNIVKLFGQLRLVISVEPNAMKGFIVLRYITLGSFGISWFEDFSETWTEEQTHVFVIV